MNISAVNNYQYQIPDIRNDASGSDKINRPFSDQRSEDYIVSIGENKNRNYTYSSDGLLNKDEEDNSVKSEDEEKKDTNSKASLSGADENDKLSKEDLEKIEKLKSRDKEVKAHEQAHIAAGGRYVRGGAHYEYQTGPDGNKYAVGGEVSIDVSKEAENHEATIAKMQVVLRAALAPAEPSSQDRAVAAQAAREMNEAMAESARLETDTKTAENETYDNEKSNNPVKDTDRQDILSEKINFYA